MNKKFKILIINILVILSIILIFPTSSIATQNQNNITNNINTLSENESNTAPTELSPEEKLSSELTSKSSILIECSTNKVAYEKNADEKMYPASTTKLLTSIIALEECSLTDTVTITSEMVNKVPKSYTTAYLQVGEVLTVEQLLNILLIPSANDAGYALAIHISGSVENFSNLMNTRATQLGCTNSNFTNPCGIHDDNHYSTARDISIIGMYALKYPIISEIGAKTSYTLQLSNGVERNFETTNTLLKQDSNTYYEYATGLKTGYTIPAGSCIVSTCKKDTMEFLAVVLNSPTPTEEINYRDNDCKLLFEYGFANYDEITKVESNFIKFFNDFIVSENWIVVVLRVVLVVSGMYVLILVVRFLKKRNK